MARLGTTRTTRFNTETDSLVRWSVLCLGRECPIDSGLTATRQTLHGPSSANFDEAAKTPILMTDWSWSPFPIPFFTSITS